MRLWNEGVLQLGCSKDRMKLFIDSADVREIREATAMGAFDGVTTIPTLLAQAGDPVHTAIAGIDPLTASRHCLDDAQRTFGA